MRRWWNGRHACFRRMCLFGREGSNPFLRILERWLSSVRHRTRNPANGFSSCAGSNPVLSLRCKQAIGHDLWLIVSELLRSSITNFWALSLKNSESLNYLLFRLFSHSGKSRFITDIIRKHIKNTVLHSVFIIKKEDYEPMSFLLFDPGF